MDGWMNGQGTITYPNGHMYEGEFKDNEKHGQGTQTFLDGYKYVGEFKEGLPHGQGTMNFPDGRKLIGEFRKDKLWNVIVYDNAGNITAKIVNGKIEQ